MTDDGDLTNQSMSFELLAASLRADAGDTRAFIEALAGKLAGALPSRVRIERAGGLFNHSHHVQRIEVQLGDWAYALAVEAGNTLDARRTHLVRGVTLKSEQLGLEEWLATLSEELAQLAQHSAQDHAALRRLLE